MSKKWSILAAVLGCILVCLTGCADRHEKNNEEMLAHMKEKYGVEFEIQNYIPRNVDCSYDVWFCNAVGDDPEQDRIEVHRYYGELAKKHVYTDEYYTRLVREEIESRATEAMLKVTNVAKVYLSDLEYAEEEYTEADQLDEFLQFSSCSKALCILIFVEDHERDSVLNSEVVHIAEKKLKDAEIGMPWIRIFFVKDSEVYQDISRDTYEEMIFRKGDDSIYTSDYSGRLSTGLTP